MQLDLPQFAWLLKRQQQLHPTLSLTDMYNVLERLRANTELTGDDRNIYEQGLISILREIHAELTAPSLPPTVGRLTSPPNKSLNTS